jgi:hypothetical protein
MWKSKEKDLSEEVAIELAKEELTSYWLGISPQLAGIRNDQSYSVFPLDPSFVKKNWLLFFIDPTEYSGRNSLVFIQEWFRRYNLHDLNLLIIMSVPYSFLQDNETIREYKHKHGILCPLAIDIGGNISGAFSAQELPKIVLLQNGHRYFDYSGKEYWKNTELDIQGFLRTKDPGLSLYPMFKPPIKIFHDTRVIEMGFSPKRGQQIQVDPPGFIPTENENRVGRFHGMRPQRISEEEVFISGEWTQDAEKAWTTDPNAAIVVAVPSGSFFFIAQSLSKTVEVPIVSVEVNGAPVFESIAGENVVLDETGMSIVKVKEAHSYEVLKDLPKQRYEIVLKFPNADLACVAIYGLRFGECVE